MVAWAKPAVSNPAAARENSSAVRSLVLDGRAVGLGLDRSYHHPLRDITASMRLADCGERGGPGAAAALQAEGGNPPGGGGGVCRGDNDGETCEECDGSGGGAAEAGRFPNVRKKFWGAAAWQSLSTPPSPTPAPLLQASGFGENRKVALPLTPRLQPLPPTPTQGGKVRPLPLQPPRRSTDGSNGALDESSQQWLPATPGGRRDIRGIIGPEMKLDLGAVQRNRDACEPTEMQLKRDKFAFFDKECSRIVEHIYLGSDAVARNRDTLREKGITHVLNCVGFVCPEYFPDDLSYKTLWLQDSPSEDITSILYDVFDYFEEVRELGGRVFVHCCQGVSRSTSLVIAYLMWRDGRNFEDAFQDVKAARGVTNPNMGFACQLLQCQKRVHAAPVSPNSALRMYRMAPHSPYDPLHLVPKTVNHPGAGALDSRGAFVVHVPSALFVWQGAQCDAGMAAAARDFTGQVVRYERAQGRVLRVAEGEEPPEFWSALKKGGGGGNRSFSHHQEVSGMGKENGSPKTGRAASPGAPAKKVPAYDVDFETYQRARGRLMPNVAESGHVPRDSGWSRLQRRRVPGGVWSRPSLKGREAAEPGAKPPNESAAAAAAASEEGWLSSMAAAAASRPTASPDASQCSSASPFSFRSFSSNSSQSPPFLTSPCMSPPPSPSLSLSHTPTPSSRLVWSPKTSSQTCSSAAATAAASMQPPFPSLDAKPSRSSPTRGGAALSLAERRGSVLPSINVPALADEPPPTPRRKPPPLPSISTKNATGRDPPPAPEMSRRGAGRRADASRPCCSSFSRSGDEDVPETSSSRSSAGGPPPILFEWPLLEKIDMFDADDLDSDAAFVLLVPDSADGPAGGGHLYLWVGASLRAEGGGGRPAAAHEGDPAKRRSQQDWHDIGSDLARQLHLRPDMPVKVVADGNEPNEFWDNFING